ncbi:MAG: hypothetical protein HYW57_04030 [Ignavibacteriales bacterium]|nr:hypothetical protein [Ignavibacteriales bacterium]
MKTMTEYEEAVRTAVCTDCIYPSGIGMCGCGQWKECPLNKFLPQAIDAVTSGKSASLVDYFKGFLAEMRIREAELSEGNRMPPGDREWFERFLPVITEAVEEIKARKLSSVKHRGFH